MCQLEPQPLSLPGTFGVRIRRMHRLLLVLLDQSALTSRCEVNRATRGDSQASCQRLKGDIQLQDKEFSTPARLRLARAPARLINLLAVPAALRCASRSLKENRRCELRN